MSIFSRKGKILRLRPGPLANFSGGAGYMPFIIIFSAPVSLIFSIVANLMLGRKIRKVETNSTDKTVPRVGATAMHEVVQIVRKHTVTCIVVAAILAFLFFMMGTGKVYSSQPMEFVHITFLLAVGPFIGWIASSYMLLKRIERLGSAGYSFFLALVTNLAIIVACAVLGWLALFST